MAKREKQAAGDVQDTGNTPLDKGETFDVVSVSVDDIAGPVLELPEATEGVNLGEEGAPDAPAATELEAEPDAFDPDIHCTDADGKPRKNQDGSFRRKPGAKRKQEAAAACDPATCRASAETAVALMVTCGQLYGGREEWEPEPEEREQLIGSFDRYFQASGSPDLPPGLALTVAVAAYAGPRFFRPRTRARTLSIVEWFKVNILGKDRPKEVTAATRAPEAPITATP